MVAVFFHEVLDDPLPLLSQTMHNDGRESRANGRARGREGRRIESWRENERRKERRSAAGIGVRAPEEGRAGDEDGEGNSGRIPKWRRLEPILTVPRCRRSIATTILPILIQSRRRNRRATQPQYRGALKSLQNNIVWQGQLNS